MENPFESGHIKNYILFYVSIVVIMILFFIASSLFNDVENFETKVFNTADTTIVEKEEGDIAKEKTSFDFKLIEVNPQSYSR